MKRKDRSQNLCTRRQQSGRRFKIICRQAKKRRFTSTGERRRVWGLDRHDVYVQRHHQDYRKHSCGQGVLPTDGPVEDLRKHTGRACRHGDVDQLERDDLRAAEEEPWQEVGQSQEVGEEAEHTAQHRAGV